ncbi:guanylate kinase [Desulfogranum japonicum]|uniref:guanylate kinase n=1 Tax=Desulfogranum japonicum TaxID=231447 RepID=UPI00042415A2|nr:guanylate kinase [Desulfogranum japonicum]
MSNGSLFVLSAPSGCGKTTMVSLVMQRLNGISFSISHTTRSARDKEVHGKDYYFVNHEEFIRIRDEENRGFIEWAEVHGNYYGTSCQEVDRLLATGSDVLLDIDVQGALQVMHSTYHPVTIFIAPPSLDELERRLRGRMTDDEHTIEVRLRNARGEIRQATKYQYLIVNDNLDEAVQSLESIIISERCRTRRTLHGEPARYTHR